MSGKLALALLASTLVGSDLGAQAPTDLPPPLRVTRAVPYDDGRETSLFVGPLRCDGDGSVYLVPQGSRGRPGDAIIRLSPDGGDRTVIDLSEAVSGLRGLLGTAVDVRGNLHALATVTADGWYRQHVVSFDAAGRLRSRVPLDDRRIEAHGLAVFGAGGRLLLLGHRPWPSQPRVAVLDLEDGAMRELTLPDPIASEMTDEWSLQPETGADGRVYLWRRLDRGGLVYAVSAAGQVSGPIAVPAPATRRRAKLGRILPSLGRLAAVFQEPIDQGSSRFWISVHDLASGKVLDAYGPVPLVACYRSAAGEPDRFTFFGARRGVKQVIQATGR